MTVIVDQLYARMLYSEENYTHLRACKDAPENIITIIGPSKTESLSGFRLGVAFGSTDLIKRMESFKPLFRCERLGTIKQRSRPGFANLRAG